MSDVSHEFLHELLRRLHQRIDKAETANRELRSENTSLRRTTTVHQNDIANIYEVLHRIDDRLDQIERRLELRDFQERAQSPYDPK